MVMALPESAPPTVVSSFHAAAGGQGSMAATDGGGQNLLGIQQESSLIACFHVITAGVGLPPDYGADVYLCVSIVIDLCFLVATKAGFMR